MTVGKVNFGFVQRCSSVSASSPYLLPYRNICEAVDLVGGEREASLAFPINEGWLPEIFIIHRSVCLLL